MILFGDTKDKIYNAVMKEAKTDSVELYKLKSYSLNVTNIPVLILDSVEGEELNGKDSRYYHCENAESL